MCFVLADYVLRRVAFRHDHVVVRGSHLPDFTDQVGHSLIALVHQVVQLRVGVLIERILLDAQARPCVERHVAVVLLRADDAGRFVRLAQLPAIDEHVMLGHLLLAHQVVVLGGHLRLERLL